MNRKKVSIICIVLIIVGISKTVFGNINPDGSLSYEVAIKLPPGTRGMAPQLSLVYNSNLDNGMAGVGWALKGLPSITRDRRQPINYDGTDSFVGPGGALVSKSGYYYYEKNGFSRFQMIGGRDGNQAEPDQWIETKPDGTRYSYGATPDSQIVANDRAPFIRVWVLQKVEDIHGNYYTIQYKQHSGEYYPELITYTYSPGVSAYRTIEFCYASGRTDSVRSYRTNTGVETKLLLTAIVLKVGNELVRKYELSYRDSALMAKKLLTSIQEVGADGSKLPPVTFTWQDETANHYFSYSENPIDPESINELNGDGRVYLGDWNGDGKTDFLWFSGPNGNNRWWLSQGNGTFTQIVSANNKDPLPNEAVNELNGNARIYIGDWNADGFSDVMWYSKEQGNNRWWLSQGNGTFQRISEDVDPIDHKAIDELNGYSEIFMLDFNGDEFTDLFWYSKEQGQNLRWLNTSNGAFEIDSYIAIDDESINLLNEYAELHFGDWNGDGLTDIMWYSKKNGDNRWFINRGNSFEQMGSIDRESIDQDDEDYDCVLYFGDWNGDGLTDVMWYRPHDGLNRWFLNGGDGNFKRYYADPNSQSDLLSAYTIQVDGKNVAARDIVIGDWNGDGISDIMLHDLTGNNIFLVNKGNGAFVLLRNCYTNSYNLYDKAISQLFTITTNYTGDFNGDGITDLLWYDKNYGTNKWLIKNTTTPPLITGIKAPTGGAQTVMYKQNKDFSGAIQPLYNQYPFAADVYPRWLVASIGTADGRGGLITKEYTYTKGLLYKGIPADRQRLNFYSISENTKNSNNQVFETNITTYRQEKDIHSVPHSVSIYRNGILSESTSYIYDYTMREKGIAHLSLRSMTTNKFVPVDFLGFGFYAELLYTHTKRYAYDSYGNVTEERNSTTGLAETVKNMNYYPADENSWILNRQENVAIKSNDVIVQQRYFNYSGNYLTEQRDWLNTENRWLASHYAYDAVGNIITLTSPGGQVTHVSYDSMYQTFPVTITKLANGREYTVQANYDARFGKEMFSIGLNGSRVEYQYDGFGRLLKTIDNGDLVEESIYEDYNGHPDKVNLQNVTNRVYSGASSYSFIKSYYDGLNRTYKQETGTSDSDSISVVEELYSPEGRVIKKSNPYLRGKETPLFTTYSYYGDGTIAAIDYPNGTRRSFAFIPDNGRLKATTIGPKGIEQVSYIDVSGNLVERSEGSGMAHISYQYDVLGRLTHVTTSGQTTTMTYDSLNRKLSITEPNKGTWFYGYTDTGKLKTQRDANGNLVSFAYDGLDRIINIDYPDGTPDVSYTYDDPAIAHSIGKVTRITNSVASSYYSYDQKGTVANWIQEIDGMRFAFGMSYDRQKRLLSMTYPDGVTTVHNDYAPSGQLSAVLMNAKALVQYKRTLDEADINTVVRRTGNGVETRIGFDPATYRPTEIKSNNNSGQIIEHNQYNYDVIGNITTITNQLNPHASESFSYDSLNRLVYAKGIYGEKSYTYDPAQPGNMTKKGNVNLYYNDVAHPHAVTTSTAGAYSYDANGNMTERKGKKLRYYADNTFKSVGTNLVADETYYYDHAKLRVKTMRADGVVRYNIGGLYEIAKIPGQTDRQTRYIYGLKGDLVAQNTSIEAFNGNQAYLNTLDAMYATTTLSGLLLKADVKARIIWAKMSNYRALSQAFFIIILLLIGALLFYFRVIKAEKSTSRPWVYRFSPLVLAAFFSVFCVPGCDNGANYGDAMDSSNATTIEETTPTVGNVGGTGEETIADPSGSQTSGSEVITLIDPAVSGGTESGGSDSGTGGGSTSGSTSGGSSTEPEINTNGFPVEGWYFFHPNHVNSTALVTDYKGDVVTRLYYTPFGEIVRSHSSGYDITKYKFTGQEEDYASGLHYFKGRFYDPEIGRFVSADAVVPDMKRALSFNRYAYVENNPVRYNDPNGHELILTCVIIGAIIGAAIFGGSYAYRQHKEGKSAGDILTDGKFYLEVLKGAIIGAAIGYSVGCAAGVASAGGAGSAVVSELLPVVSGSANAYYAWKQNKSSNDVYMAFMISWGSSVLMNMGMTSSDQSSFSLLSEKFDSIIPILGANIFKSFITSVTANLYTQLYFYLSAKYKGDSYAFDFESFLGSIIAGISLGAAGTIHGVVAAGIAISYFVYMEHNEFGKFYKEEIKPVIDEIIDIFDVNGQNMRYPSQLQHNIFKPLSNDVNKALIVDYMSF